MIAASQRKLYSDVEIFVRRKANQSWNIDRSEFVRKRFL